MADKKAFECKSCGNRVEVDDPEADVPECCNLEMDEAGPLPVCEISTTAEHSRLDDLGDPCDDGRSG